MKIQQKIVHVAVATPENTPVAKKRPEVLRGATYKLKAGEAGTYYVTINDDAEGKPFELFISTTNIEHQAWVAALTFSVSALFRRLESPGEAKFLVEKLKAIHDPKGGYWSKGQYVPSVCAGLGRILEQHLGLGHRVEVDRATTACPECGDKALVVLDGCATCTTCGYGKCG